MQRHAAVEAACCGTDDCKMPPLPPPRPGAGGALGSPPDAVAPLPRLMGTVGEQRPAAPPCGLRLAAPPQPLPAFQHGPRGDGTVQLQALEVLLMPSPGRLQPLAVASRIVAPPAPPSARDGRRFSRSDLERRQRERQDRRETTAAVRLQALFRRVAAERAYSIYQRRRQQAAVAIQGSWRRRQLRQELAARSGRRRERRLAACRIQALHRGRRTRQHLAGQASGASDGGVAGRTRSGSSSVHRGHGSEVGFWEQFAEAYLCGDAGACDGALAPARPSGSPARSASCYGDEDDPEGELLANAALFEVLCGISGVAVSTFGQELAVVEVLRQRAGSDAAGQVAADIVGLSMSAALQHACEEVGSFDSLPWSLRVSPLGSVELATAAVLSPSGAFEDAAIGDLVGCPLSRTRLLSLKEDPCSIMMGVGSGSVASKPAYPTSQVVG